MPGLTLGQQKALAFAPKPTAALSVLCSIYIIVAVLRNPRRRKKMYHRLMLAMSIMTALKALCFFFGTWAIPRGTPNTYGASGTTGTCTAQGFALLIGGLSAQGYYASLSLFSFLAVRNNFSEEKLVKTEPWIHLFVYVFSVSTAIAALANQFINPSGPWCWVNSYPAGCTKTDMLECTRGDNAHRMTSAIVVVYLLYLLFATLMMGLLYWTVRLKEERNASLVGKKKILEDARRTKSRVIAMQALLYLAAFFSVHIVAIMARSVEWFGGSFKFPAIVLGIVLNSFQGIFNLLVYVRLNLRPQKESEDQTKSGVSAMHGHPAYVPNPGQHVAVAHIPRRLSLSQEHFSIFDGTNASGSPWARFLCDESDDEEPQGMKKEGDNAGNGADVFAEEALAVGDTSQLDRDSEP